MDTINFDKLLLKTAFCCMASDGHIDQREVTLIQTMCAESPLFKDFDFQGEMNALVEQINARGTEFITNYFGLLGNSTLTEEEELLLIDFAIKTIYADNVVEYAEIKFFKVIRHNLKVKDEVILAKFPDIEDFLQADIVTESYLEKITKQYLKIADLPQFDAISLDALNKDGK